MHERMRFGSVVCLILALLSLAISRLAPADEFVGDSGNAPIVNPIGNFHEVSPGIFRSARPNPNGIHFVATELGVKTDLDLEDDAGAIAVEKKAVAQESGMVMISIPLSGHDSPAPADANRAIAILADPANYPVLVHCKAGEDRTGLIVGLYRVLDEKMAPADAYHEMRQYGFHPLLLGLLHYYEKVTGYHPSIFGF